MKKIISLALVSTIFVAIMLILKKAVFSTYSAFMPDAMLNAVIICASFFLACFILGAATGDYSQTDRLWSIAPAVYAWVFAYGCRPDTRAIVMSVLATLWGARLTFNFARKGGYTTEEDYRWIFLRTKIKNPFAWQVFNFVFIAGYQHFIVFLFTLPVIGVCQSAGKELGIIDFVLIALFVVMLVFETAADQQMWKFQLEKKRMVSAGEKLEGDYKKEFITSGLFRFSRHPNYFGEMSIWVVFYLFVPAAGGALLHWTLTGAVLLILLFQGSIWITEYLSSAKYPQYKEYKKFVSRCIPLPSKIKS
jgi:steroid 5-alpha reductase family enzyme